MIKDEGTVMNYRCEIDTARREAGKCTSKCRREHFKVEYY